MHNAGASYQNDNGDFVGKLHGEDVELKNVKMKDIEYVKRNPTETNSLRNNFNSSAKKDFLNELSNMKDSSLKKMGLSNKDILQIRDGKVPKGYQVHHKLPLDDSGNNNFENLNLIKNDPYHKVITNYQNTFSKGMLPGDKIDIKWPIPEGPVYIGK